MKSFKHFFVSALICGFIAQPAAHAQLGGLGKKLKQAAEKALQDEIGVGNPDVPDTPQPDNGDNSNTNNSSIKGKKLTPPDVSELLDNAKAALASEQYANARYEVKEAVKGVELEIGYQILAAMPGSVSGLSYNEEDDGIVSTGMGFAGLVINRYYQGNNKRVTSTIGNNSAIGASYSYMMNAGYASSNDNVKSVTVQGYRGTLSFDGNNTYTLGIPFAQSSVFILEGEGFADEDELQQAADNFDIATFEDLLTDNETDDATDTDIDAYLTSAGAKYKSEDYEGTRFDLQRSLTELDIVISKKILEMLPTTLAGLEANISTDEYVANSAGFAGVYISRTYGGTTGSQQIEINLVDDSPMMAMVSQFINMPMMVGMSGNKSVKIDGYKGMMEVSESGDNVEHAINIPSGQSLLTINFSGFDESKAVQAANQVPVGQIFSFVK